MENQPLQVVATRVTQSGIYYICPDCHTKYNKDGKPSLRAKHMIHVHGSNGNTRNRIETRTRHCLNHSGDVHITINDSTSRK